MTCDDCERCREAGYSFCNKCGEPLDMPPEREEEEKPSIFCVAAVILAIIGIVANVFLMTVQFGNVWSFAAGKKVNLYIYLMGQINIGAVDAQIWWVILFVVLIAVVALFFYRSRSAMSYRKGMPLKTFTDTPLFWTALLICTVIFLEIVVNLVMQLLGFSVDVPPFIAELTPEEAIFTTANAAVWEEVAFRLVPVGIPMMVVAACYRRKDFLRYLFGGFGVTRLTVVLMMLSSVMFAYAHVDGWGLWKLFSVMIGAFAMGYLYIRFGIIASIMFHFLTDLMLPWSLYNAGVTGLYEIVLIGLGVLCLPVLAVKTKNGLEHLKTMENTGFGQKNDDSNTD